MDVPIVFVHRSGVVRGRGQGYVRVAIEQAKRHNRRVILLGDDHNKGFGAEHHNVYDYFEGAKWLADNYVHMSSNTAPFEIAATQGGFVLREFMLKENIKVVALCETDTMLYCNMTDIVKSLGAFTAAYAIPQNQPEYRWSASFHASLWTLAGIEKFCDIVKHGYSVLEGLERIKSKYNWHIGRKDSGGICVMTFLWFLSQETDGIINLSEVRDGSVFDHNIRVTENYGPNDFELEEVEGYTRPVKRIVWQNGLPFGRYLPTDSLVRFNALHFNSSSKVLMKDYQTGG